MRILLLGEFSAFHKNLKEGLVALGHDVTIASSGDGWKKIEGDVNLGSDKNGLIGRALKVKNLLKALFKMQGYDVVQFISPNVFPTIFGINRIIAIFIFLRNQKVFLVGAGCNDTITADFFEKEYKYPEFYNQIKKNSHGLWCQTLSGRKFNKWFLSKINGFIPIMYEYAQGYRNKGFNKLCPTIPIPINIDKIKYKENVVGNKIVFFHGLNREGVKGTPLIRDAMKRLEMSFPDEVECLQDGKMPLYEYLLFLKGVNVVIDQAFSVSVGVNGVYNLAMGKVVLGGGELEFLNEFDLKDSPLLPIKPTVDDIYSQMVFVVANKDKIFKMGEKSRQFAENIHHYKTVAQQYIDLWEAY